MFSEILIANRGEIACRVAATAKKLGVRTVAVYSDADRFAKHVAVCDEAIYIGGSAPKDSYLRWERILEATKQTGAQAIHPGYGFLSENDEFAQACVDAGLVFIGPPASAITAMGLKAESKRLMEAANVPLIPGYHGTNQDPEFLHSAADKIGYPVLIKASSGGGGKGMRLVEKTEDFIDALGSCQREAISSFGNDSVLIEKYALRPRHQINEQAKEQAFHLTINTIAKAEKQGADVVTPIYQGDVRYLATADDTFTLWLSDGETAGKRQQMQAWRHNEQVYVFSNHASDVITLVDSMAHVDIEPQDGGSLKSPMPGQVVAFRVNVGDEVKKGQALAVIEAMKIEHTINAPSDGTVAELLFKAGDLVSDGDELLKLDTGSQS